MSYLHFFYVDYKKTNKNYIAIIKSKNKDQFPFNDLNNILYNYLHLLNYNYEYDLDENKQVNNINYFEYFYIKKGLIINYEKYIWNKLIKIYLEELDIKYLIDGQFVSNIYSKNIILFDYNQYSNKINKFLIDHYDDKVIEDYNNINIIK